MSEYEGILASLEDLHKKVDRLLASGGEKEERSFMDTHPKVIESITPNSKLPEVRIHSPGFADYKPEKTTVKEELDMDFSKVTVMNQTDKALLVVKNGYQQWLAKQFIKEALVEYFEGNMYDIELKEQSDAGKPLGWITKKWKPFEVFKS